MAKRRTRKTTRTARRSAPRATHHTNPGMIIQLGVVFIVVAAMLLAGYVGGLYMK